MLLMIAPLDAMMTPPIDTPDARYAMPLLLLPMLFTFCYELRERVEAGAAQAPC